MKLVLGLSYFLLKATLTPKGCHYRFLEKVALAKIGAIRSIQG